MPTNPREGQPRPPGDGHDLAYEALRAVLQASPDVKMKSIGPLAGGVAHDMNNILTVVLTMATLLERKTDAADPRSQGMRDIRDAAMRGRSLVEQLVASPGAASTARRAYPSTISWPTSFASWPTRSRSRSAWRPRSTPPPRTSSAIPTRSARR